ncbi:TolC family protein [Ciceribacter sp. RN22]|nr:TolC family protein [Ciceribacter sp. RN22]
MAGVNAKIARSGYFPSLQASANVGADGLPGVQVGVTQTLYDWHETSAKVDEAAAKSEVARFNLAAKREEVALDAAKAYIALKRHEAHVEAAEANLTAHDRINTLARERASGGVGDASEVERAGVNMGEAESTLEDVRGALRDAQSVFVSRIGRQPTSLALVPELPLTIADITDVRKAVANAPAVAAAYAEGLAAEHAARSERASLFPKLTAEVQFRATEGVSNSNPAFMLRLRSPTYAGLSAVDQVASAELKVERANTSAETASRKAVDDVLAFKDRVPTLRNRLSILRTQLDRAEALRDLYEEQFTLGDRSLNDLISVQSDVYRIERTLIEARYDMLDLQYGAAAALGRLQEMLAKVKDVRPQPDRVRPARRLPAESAPDRRPASGTLSGLFSSLVLRGSLSPR